MSRTIASQAGRGSAMRRALLLAPLGAALALAGCARPAWVSPVEVTRFVGAAPTQLGQGTISVAPAPGTPLSDAEFAPWRAAVATELSRLGYQIVGSGGRQVAQVTVERAVGSEGPRRSPVSVGGGASVGSYGSGVGLGIGLDLSGRPAERIDTRLSVAIRSSTGGPNLWEGRASMSATGNSDYAAPEASAARLAAALLAGFPGNSGETVIIE